jgi:Xaa-Pro aminopeptidase
MGNVFADRREALRRKLKENDLEAYLVLHPANRYYLSGFELHDPQCNESAGCLLITVRGDDWLGTDGRFLEAARQCWPEEAIFCYTGNRAGQLAEFLAHRTTSLGFESRIMNHELFDKLSSGLELQPSRGLVEELRMVKDESEIEALRRSCRLNHEVLTRLESQRIAGRSETDIAWELEKSFREGGASELAFPPIVASGANAARPHHLPSPTEIHEQSPLLLDVGARLRDYCSDQSRTLWIGSDPPSEFHAVLDLVQRAQKLALDSVRPGLAVRDLYAEVSQFFQEHGVAEHFPHALGHGIGLETHEPPGLGSKSQDVLQPGMVITIEPGLYYPGWGGVRWEHMVVVREDGAEVL